MPDEREEADAGIDRLYALPLDDFTTARDELARGLRQAGDRAGADEVKQLRKPSVAAWALNQVRRNERDQSDELIGAGGRLAEAHERLLAGQGRESLERAAEDERRLVAELARHAERELEAAGRPVSGPVQEKLRTTLHAVASDPGAREGFVLGRLVREHEASGFGPLPQPSAASRPAGARGSTSDAAAAEVDRRKRELEERIERSRARQRELADEHAEAGRRLREARRAATSAAAQLEKAEAAEERARADVEEAAAGVRELERELHEAGRSRG